MHLCINEEDYQFLKKLLCRVAGQVKHSVDNQQEVDKGKQTAGLFKQTSDYLPFVNSLLIINCIH